MRSESPEDVPWTTAPERLETFLADLDIPDDSETAELAREYAHRHGIEEPIDRSPSSVAAGAIYLAHMFELGRALTQQEIQDATGVYPVTVTRGYRDIARAEGIPIAGDHDDDEPADLRRNVELGWGSIGVAGAVFGLGLTVIVIFWTGVVTPLVGSSPIGLAAMVLPTAVFAILALEAGLRVGEASAR